MGMLHIFFHLQLCEVEKQSVPFAFDGFALFAKGSFLWLLALSVMDYSLGGEACESSLLN